jgi:choline-sulfatase
VHGSYRSLPLILLLFASACGGSPPTNTPPNGPGHTAPIRNVVLVTIDTLRADHVGAYGYAAAQTPALDGLARDGVLFTHAYAAAPITLTSHASLMTGLDPPGHAARDNGMRVDVKGPMLAERFASAGFATGAFVAAFPLDSRFGLNKGFETYGDRMPRGPDGRLASERPGRMVVDEALAWLDQHRNDRCFLWVHLFEPHAPYGNPADSADAQRPAKVRYDEDVAEADRQVARLLDRLGDARKDTLTVVAADHGEAFGEHEEISHSVFVYDTTLRVPLIFAGPGLPHGMRLTDDVSLVDVAPTIARLAQLGAFDADGVDLSALLTGGHLGPRRLYAESFAPLLDFGWSPLRAIRADGWKYIAAPTPELYNLTADPGETRNMIKEEPQRAADLARRVDAISPGTLPAHSPATDPETQQRLQALGYASGGRDRGGARPDPKDRRAQAARIAQVTSGELHGAALEQALRAILKEDPENSQANVRLGYVLMNSGRCRDAVPHFSHAIAAGLPGADAYLGLAGCQVAARDVAAAEKTLRNANQSDPDDPIVLANLGIVLSDHGRAGEGLPYLQRAVTLDPDLHQGRFSLAIAYARLGRQGDAAKEAEELLRRLPQDAPQRPEVERLLKAVR